MTTRASLEPDGHHKLARNSTFLINRNVPNSVGLCTALLTI